MSDFNWMSGMLLSDQEYEEVIFLYNLHRRIERLESPNSPPKKPIGCLTMQGSHHVVSNDLARELNRIRLPMIKKKKSIWSTLFRMSL